MTGLFRRRRGQEKSAPDGRVSRAAKGGDCKSPGYAFVGSSPTSPTISLFSMRCLGFSVACDRCFICAALSCAFHGLDFVERAAQGVGRRFKRIAALKIHPEFGARPKETGKAQGRVRRQIDLLISEAFSAGERNADRARHRAGRKVEWRKKFLPKDFAGVDRRAFGGVDGVYSVVFDSSTSAGPWSVQTKQSRNGSLTRIEYGPARSPFSVSSR